MGLYRSILAGLDRLAAVFLIGLAVIVAVVVLGGGAVFLFFKVLLAPGWPKIESPEKLRQEATVLSQSIQPDKDSGLYLPVAVKSFTDWPPTIGALRPRSGKVYRDRVTVSTYFDRENYGYARGYLIWTDNGKHPDGDIVEWDQERGDEIDEAGNITNDRNR